MSYVKIPRTTTIGAMEKTVEPKHHRIITYIMRTYPVYTFGDPQIDIPTGLSDLNLNGQVYIYFVSF